MAKAKMPHPGHDEHLCYLVNVGHPQQSLEEYKALVRDGKYFCDKCGRVAAEEKNLCSPQKL